MHPPMASKQDPSIRVIHQSHPPKNRSANNASLRRNEEDNQKSNQTTKSLHHYASLRLHRFPPPALHLQSPSAFSTITQQLPTQNLPRTSLPSSMPSIHPQIRPRHKGTSITNQKHRSPPILLRATQPSQHILAWPVRLPLREALEQLRHHLRDDIAG